MFMLSFAMASAGAGGIAHAATATSAVSGNPTTVGEIVVTAIPKQLR